MPLKKQGIGLIELAPFIRAYDKIYKIKKQELITDPLITNIEKEIIQNFKQSPLKGFETLWINEQNAEVT